MARLVRVTRRDQLPAALQQLEIGEPRAVLVVVVVVGGGTDSGVMLAMGQARAAASARSALVGVVADGTVVGGSDQDTPQVVASRIGARTRSITETDLRSRVP
jgi:hypothetical protein